MKEIEIRAHASQLILNGRLEKALNILSDFYKVPKPKVAVGLPENVSNCTLACYNPHKKTIYVKSRKHLRNPLIILHELHHHTRFSRRKHWTPEKHATKFAIEALEYLIKKKSIIHDPPK